MSRQKVIVGSDPQGRPITRWADAPALGAALPISPPGPVERSFVSPATNGDAPPRDLEQVRRIATAKGVALRAVERPKEDSPMPTRLTEHGPVTIEPTPFERLEAAARRMRDAHEAVLVAEQDLARARADSLEAQEELEAAWGQLPIQATGKTRPGRKPKTDASRVDELLTPPRPVETIAEPPPPPLVEERPATPPVPPRDREYSSIWRPEGLARRQGEIYDAMVRAGGDRKKAAELVKTSVAGVEATLEQIGRRYGLAPELIEHLPSRFGKWARKP